MLINDRLSTILPTVGAFRRRSMQVKWLSCKGLTIVICKERYAQHAGFAFHKSAHYWLIIDYLGSLKYRSLDAAHWISLLSFF